MALLPFSNAPGSSGGSGTVTSVSVTTANGVSGSVANPTTTPAISLTLGAITPSSINSVVLSGSSTPTLAVTGTSSISGANTGDQTITLTGDVTGSGTGSFATTIKNDVALAGSPTTTTQTPGDNSTKLATTAYVQAAVFGTTTIAACKYATTAALTVTYSNGSSGVGATLTEVGLGALSVDGVTPSVADRILVKDQASTFQNGIYVVTTVGNAGVAYVLTRSSDYNVAADIDLGDTTFITAGNTLANTTWTQNGTQNPVMGTDAITFAQTAGPGSYTAGNGISITGTSIAIDTSVTVDKTTAQTLTNKTLTAPVMTAPVLGTPASGVATNLTGTASGLTAGTVTTNANLTGPITSTGNATAIASQTGTGSKFVVDTSPTLVTPNIGVATATSVNKVAITAPATSATLTIPDGVTLTGPAASGTAMTLGNTETVTGVKTFGSAGAVGRLKIAGTTSGSTVLDATAVASGTLTLPAATDTLVGKATTDTLTNKTLTTPTIGDFTNATHNHTNAAGGGLLNLATADTTAWGSYTPTWANYTRGNGTSACAYRQIGKTVYFRIVETLGSTSSMGTIPTFTLPVTSLAVPDTLLVISNGLIFNGSGSYNAFSTWTTTTTSTLRFWDVNNNLNNINSTSPGTWATGWKIILEGFYEAA